MSDNELLLALRNEIQPIKDTLQETRNELHDFRLYVENEIEPKIQLLAENYVPAAKRYEKAMPEIDEVKRPWYSKKSSGWTQWKTPKNRLEYSENS